MRFLSVLMLLLVFACGKDNKSSGSGSNGLSQDPYRQSTVTGYVYSNGTIKVGNKTYQMTSTTLNNQTINQQLNQSGVQPVYENGVARFKARITGNIQCGYGNTGYNNGYQNGQYNNGYNNQYNNQYNNGYNNNYNQCNANNAQSFNVTAITFVRG